MRESCRPPSAMMRLVFLLMALAAVALGDEASRLVQEARRAERQGDDLRAFGLYSRAAGMRPERGQYRRQAERLRGRAAHSLAGMGRLEQAFGLDPANAYMAARLAAPPAAVDAPLTAAEIREAEQLAEPLELRPGEGRRSFDLSGDARSIYEQVMRAWGLEVVFDADLPLGSRLRLGLNDEEFRTALRALMALTGTFVVPIHERVALVAQDTTQKRNELEPMMATIAPIPLVMTTEEANEIGRTVQQALDIRRVVVDPGRRQVLIRDTVTKVRLARAMYEELSRRRAEVSIEVELISAGRSTLTNFGLSLPTSFPVSYLGTFWNRPAPVTAVAGPLLGLGAGATLFGVAIGSGLLRAEWSRSQTEFLSRFWLRSIDGMAASLHIGDKFPIINASFSPIVITDEIRDLERRGLLRQPFPSFTFEDLGLVLKITPRIHDSREVSLTIEAEFRLLTGETFNSVPVIANRKFNSAVRLKEGESGLVAGMLVTRDSRTATGLAGLAHIPLFGRLLRQTSWQDDQSELVISITPRLTGIPPGEQFFSRTYHFGADTRPVSPI